MAPIVPGTNRKRQVSRRRGRAASSAASAAATTIPDRLSLASEGWQQWVETSTSSEDSPASTVSP
jgi:hypothetical protein